MTEPLPAFIEEILGQSEAMEAVAASWNRLQFSEASASMRGHSRIILTGMGASFAALLPAWRMLIGAGCSAWHIETAELLTLSDALLGPDTIVVAASQSGRSAELVSLAEKIRHRSALLSITNETSSPLACASEIVIPLLSGPETAVSTKSYLNTLAVSTALAQVTCAEENNSDDWNDLVAAWLGTAVTIKSYLGQWRRNVNSFKTHIGLPDRSVLLGRGSSVASALYGALIIKEAAKWPIEPMTSSQFRHGPLEMTDPRLTAFMLAGADGIAKERNIKLAHDIAAHGGKICWFDTSDGLDGAVNIKLPSATVSATPIIEALPLQLLSIAIAELIDIEPGKFRYLEKVTTIE
jgi:glucosamine--fructose-6-phosphate aminotransferase (isomerizing)